VVGAALDVVVVGAALDVVVVGAALDVVVVGAALDVVVVGAALDVVVVGAALDVVVVAAPVVVVVVAPLQGLCAQETAPSDVPPCLEQLSAVNCPHVGGFPGMQQAILFVGFAWAVAFKGTNTTTSSTLRIPRMTIERSAFRMTASVYRGDEARAGLVGDADTGVENGSPAARFAIPTIGDPSA